MKQLYNPETKAFDNITASDLLNFVRAVKSLQDARASINVPLTDSAAVQMLVELLSQQ